ERNTQTAAGSLTGSGRFVSAISCREALWSEVPVTQHRGNLVAMRRCCSNGAPTGEAGYLLDKGQCLSQAFSPDRNHHARSLSTRLFRPRRLHQQICRTRRKTQLASEKRSHLCRRKSLLPVGRG